MVVSNGVNTHHDCLQRGAAPDATRTSATCASSRIRDAAARASATASVTAFRVRTVSQVCAPRLLCVYIYIYIIYKHDKGLKARRAAA